MESAGYYFFLKNFFWDAFPYGDFHTIPSVPIIAFEHLSLYIHKTKMVYKMFFSAYWLFCHPEKWTRVVAIGLKVFPMGETK